MPRYYINESLLGEKSGIERLSSHFRLLYQGHWAKSLTTCIGPYEKICPYNDLWVVLVVVVHGIVVVMVVAY